MKRAVSVLLALVAVVMAATTALGGERDGAFSVSPFIGGYTFDGTQHLETAPVYGVRLGYDITSHLGVEAVSDFLYTHRTRISRSQKMLSYRLDLLYNFLPDGPFVPYLAVGGGGLTYGNYGIELNGKNTDATANVGAGVKYFVTDSIALRGDARQLFVLEDPKPPKYNWEYSVGLSFLFGGSQPAAAKAAPVTAAGAETVAPAPPAPMAVLKVIPAAINASQPATLAWSSRNAANCDLQPGVGPVQPEGSMTVTPSADTEYTLTCQGAGGSASAAARLQVAPAQGAQQAPSAAQGGQEQAGMTSTVEFAVASAEIAAGYQKGLQEAARYLKEHPDSKATVAGYTDSIGPEWFNSALSGRRAQAVKSFLVKHAGIDPARVSSKGYGSSQPVGDNATSDGRQKNRRAVVTIVLTGK